MDQVKAIYSKVQHGCLRAAIATAVEIRVLHNRVPEVHTTYKIQRDLKTLVIKKNHKSCPQVVGKLLGDIEMLIVEGKCSTNR